MRFFPVFTCVFSGVLAFSQNNKVVANPQNRLLQICYISMNNEKEFHLTKSFVDRIQRLSGKNLIQVKEFLEKGGSPEQTLDKMIEKNEVCDGLVISGHHTGSFGGSRAQGSLSVEFMERVSCQKNKSKWFESVNSLWLQGCRTLGAPGEVGENNVNLAEFHANRVNTVRTEDGLEQNRLQLAQEFSDLLDAQTPYATRFMKSFPQARLYGWTRTAPGERKGSERSLPFHIHNMAIRSGGEDMKNKIKNPFDANLTAEQAQIYLDALLKLLNKPKAAEDITASLTAWEDHGKPNYRIGTIGFDNDDLGSMPPLFGNGDAVLPQSRTLECKLRNGKTAKETIENVNEILKDPRLIALTFYTLKDVINNDSEGTSQYRSNIINQMKSNQNLMMFLQDKLKNVHASLVRRLEYYGFLNLVDGKQAQSYAGELQQKVEGELLKIGKENDYEERDYKVKIVEESIKSKLLSVRDFQKLFERTKDKNLAQAFIRIFSGQQIYLPDNKLAELLNAVYDADPGLSGDILSALARIDFWHPTFNPIVEAAIAGAKARSDSHLSSQNELVASAVLPENYLNQIAEFVVLTLPALEINANYNYNVYQVSATLNIITNNRIREDLRKKSIQYLADFFTLSLENADDEKLKVFVTYMFQNSAIGKIREDQISKSEKTKLSQLVLQLFAKAKTKAIFQDYQFSQALLYLYNLGAQEQALAIAKEEIKTEAGLKKVEYFIIRISEGDEFIHFDMTDFIKKLLRSSDYGQHSAIDILLRSKVDPKFFYEVIDQVSSRPQVEFLPLSLLIRVGQSKFLPAEAKKMVTERIKAKMPIDAISDPFFQLAIGFINPYYKKVTSQMVLEMMGADPHNSQLRAFYVWVWLSERPKLSELPPQLDAYLKNLGEEAISMVFWADDITGKIPAELRRDIYLKTLEFNSITPEKLGELKEVFRGQDDKLSKFEYKDIIIQKIDEKLFEIYN